MAAACPAAASAGTLTRSAEPGLEGSTPVMNVTYVLRAGGREANRVRVRLVEAGGNGLVIRDGGGTVAPRSADCASLGRTVARCVAPRSISGRRVGRIGVRVETGDRADRVRLGVGVPGTVVLGRGDDRGLAAGGDVRMLGGGGRDVLRSGAGRDRLDGGAGSDVLAAGDGHDTLLGRRGNDRLHGGAGADRLADGPGRDLVLGGSGADRIRPRGTRRGVQEVGCGRGRDLVLSPDRFVNLGRDCELVEGARGDRLFMRPLHVRRRSLVFLAGCAKRGCLGSRRAGSRVSVALGADPPRRGRPLGRRRYRVGLLGSEDVPVRLSRAELRLLAAPGGTPIEIRAADFSYRTLVRVR